MRFSELPDLNPPQKRKSSEPQRFKESIFSNRREPAHAGPKTPRFDAPAAAVLSGVFPKKISSSLKDDDFKAANVYGNLVRSSREILAGLSKELIQMPDLEEICEAIDRVIGAAEQEACAILELAARSTPDDYLPGHIANVTVLCIALSRELKCPKETQRALGVGALLHDAGIAFQRLPCPDSEIFSPEEKGIMRKLPDECIRILKDFLESLAPPSRAVVENVILQSQERISGEGYPNNLKGSQISQEAQVVGLCDTYEALSHPRPYRQRKLPHDTLRYLIELAGETFDAILIKKLWETLGLFPPGSFVKLNTNEIAKIVGTNKTFPTRPVVRLIASASGEKIAGEKLIDLSQAPGIAIERAVDECSLNLADRRLVLELRTQKWWFN
jgi:HD-GYP domain-containing protein (c-di-GMP phosphodiesterase class II)